MKKEETKYIMQSKNAEGMLLEFRGEMDKMFSEMDDLARDIDKEFEGMLEVGGEREILPPLRKERRKQE